MHPNNTLPPRFKVNCATCGKEVEVYRSRFLKGRKCCCSLSCAAKQRTKSPLEDRFWSKVDRSGGPAACWLWKASINSDGYGTFHTRNAEGERKGRKAHGMAWELTFGTIPEDQEVCHNCPEGDNRACCNPAHLWLGTHAENVQDAVDKGRLNNRGENSARAVLTWEQVEMIRAAHVPYKVSARMLAERFGFPKGAVQHIVAGTRWKRR